ncbi:MAG: hypothetical protein LCH59_11070 [Proteobacteria bacterium]|nr:hypothetical protein [Pseudomonadota bacterium]
MTNESRFKLVRALRSRLCLFACAGLLASPMLHAEALKCDDLPELEVSLRFCEANLEWQQDRYQLAMESAIERSGDPALLQEDDRQFQSRLRQYCSTLQCVADAYADQVLYLDNLEFRPAPVPGDEAPAPGEDDTVVSTYGADLITPLEDEPAEIPDAVVDAYPYDADSPTAGVIEQTVTPPSHDPPSAAPASENVNVQAAEKNTRPHGISDQMLTLFLWAIIGGLLLLLLMAATNRVVVFYDYTDAWWSIAPFLSLIVGLMVSNSLAPPEMDRLAPTFLGKLVMLAAVLFSLLATFITYRNAIHYNRSLVLGLLIGTCKLLIALPMAFTFFGALRNVFNPKIGRRQNLAALFIVFVIGALWAMLVNGKRVHQQRDWLDNRADGSERHADTPHSTATPTPGVRRIT